MDKLEQNYQMVQNNFFKDNVAFAHLSSSNSGGLDVKAFHQPTLLLPFTKKSNFILNNIIIFANPMMMVLHLRNELGNLMINIMEYLTD